jgi:hypothetical protein
VTGIEPAFSAWEIRIKLIRRDRLGPIRTVELGRSERADGLGFRRTTADVRWMCDGDLAVSDSQPGEYAASFPVP